MIVRLRHPCDHHARHWHPWPFVYLHGQAEEVNQVVAEDAHFWVAADVPDDDLPYSYSDIFYADVSMPSGQAVVEAELYGRAARIFVVPRGNHLCGRGVLVNDPDGLAHAMSGEWR